MLAPARAGGVPGMGPFQPDAGSCHRDPRQGVHRGVPAVQARQVSAAGAGSRPAERLAPGACGRPPPGPCSALCVGTRPPGGAGGPSDQSAVVLARDAALRQHSAATCKNSRRGHPFGILNAQPYTSGCPTGAGDGEAASNQPGPPRPATAPRVRQRVLVGQAEGWVDDQAQPQQELPRGVYGLAHQLEAQVLCAGPRNPQAPALHEVLHGQHLPHGRAQRGGVSDGALPGAGAGEQRQGDAAPRPRQGARPQVLLRHPADRGPRVHGRSRAVGVLLQKRAGAGG
mmetsp:Transcript_49899/g.95351  ORF Transcript_49899/g.95351 Transcript_49899/m.95351 type:complete len:285 (+) Transcript_49899:211-1065(+)